MCERLCGKKVQKMLTRKQKEREKDITNRHTGIKNNIS